MAQKAGPSGYPESAASLHSVGLELGWFVQRRILAGVGWPEPLERFIVLVAFCPLTGGKIPLVSKALDQATSQKEGEQRKQTLNAVNSELSSARYVSLKAVGRSAHAQAQMTSRGNAGSQKAGFHIVC